VSGWEKKDAVIIASPLLGDGGGAGGAVGRRVSLTCRDRSSRMVGRLCFPWVVWVLLLLLLLLGVSVAVMSAPSQCRAMMPARVL